VALCVSDPGKGTDMVHHIQAKQAFVAHPRRVKFWELDRPQFILDKAWVSLDRIWRQRPRNEEVARRRAHYDSYYFDSYWYVFESKQLWDLLQRDDLTKRNGRPLVATNEKADLIAFAVGPAEAPRRLAISGGAFDLKRHVFVAADETQPEWWLLEACVVDPFHGSTGASAWVAKWKAQAEAGEEPSWD
jgi:hypothetical protein